MKNLNDLEKKYENCKLCKELVENRNNVVFGTGNSKTTKICIIGEAPGKQEDLNKTPFVGRSGKILDSFLNNIGLSRSKDVYITNTILCRPPKNRNPTKSELTNCRERFEKQMELLNPKVIITLGNFATKYVLDTKKGINEIRGQIFKTNFKQTKIKVIPMLHPAVVLYNGNSEEIKNKFYEDFNVLKKTLKLKDQPKLNDFT